jgi:hypothetical protein
MKYMLLMYADETTVPKLSPEEFKAEAQAWQTFAREAQEAGVLLYSTGLASVANATTVRIRDGKTLTTDGPFAETHEQLGGCQYIECKDLDEAIAWAAKIPTARYGAIEVRPQWQPTGKG